MRLLFKLMSLLRWGRAISRDKIAQRYARIKAIRSVNKYIR
jgi:hypothetical protein